MADFQRPLYARIARLLACLDAGFLAGSGCYFGGGTQLAMSHGEYRESRDMDLLVSSRAGFRAIRETISQTSLGSLFRKPVPLAREVRADRDALRTFLRESPAEEALKFEVLFEARLDLAGALDPALGVPVLAPEYGLAEKLLANADRGLDRVYRSRDLVDLAFVSLRVEEATLRQASRLAREAYGNAVARALAETLRMVELDARYRDQCIRDLGVTDPKTLREGLTKLQARKRLLAGAGGATRNARKRPKA
ncbi:MAG: nucleotidyl transferase AbiEii/AbiGii toxin family protein [Burkholderiales bacterium]|nr:nucleotidyl transferase AbiEii/AbiGii toxin family protein [Burkholderiales bacterium]